MVIPGQEQAPFIVSHPKLFFRFPEIKGSSQGWRILF